MKFYTEDTINDNMFEPWQKLIPTHKTHAQQKDLSILYRPFHCLHYHLDKESKNLQIL